MEHPFEDANPDELKRIFLETEIRRSPLTGIVAGYHHLPFTLIGPNDEEDDSPTADAGSLMLTGKITVSPKLVVTLRADDEAFGDIFPKKLLLWTGVWWDVFSVSVQAIGASIAFGMSS